MSPVNAGFLSAEALGEPDDSRRSGMPPCFPTTPSCPRLVTPYRWLVLLVESHKLLISRRLVKSQFHHLIIYSLSTGGIERGVVRTHHTLLCRTVHALIECIATLVGADLLVGKLGVVDELRPDDLRGVFLRIDIHKPDA